MMNYARSGPICGGLPPFFDLGTLTIVFSGQNGSEVDVDLTHFAKMILSWTKLLVLSAIVFASSNLFI